MENPASEFANRFTDLLAGDLTVSNRSTRVELAVKIDVTDAVRQGFLPKAPRKESFQIEKSGKRSGNFLRIPYLACRNNRFYSEN